MRAAVSKMELPVKTSSARAGTHSAKQRTRAATKAPHLFNALVMHMCTAPNSNKNIVIKHHEIKNSKANEKPSKKK